MSEAIFDILNPVKSNKNKIKLWTTKRNLTKLKSY